MVSDPFEAVEHLETQNKAREDLTKELKRSLTLRQWLIHCDGVQPLRFGNIMEGVFKTRWIGSLSRGFTLQIYREGGVPSAAFPAPLAPIQMRAEGARGIWRILTKGKGSAYRDHVTQQICGHFDLDIELFQSSISAG